MSNEIKIGEYVRTKNGKIDKVINNNYYINWYIECEKGVIDREMITKHDKDLTDLLEDTDILKVKITEEWVEKEDTIAFIVVEQLESIKEIKEALENGMYTIEQILTHEQFERNSYKMEV